MKKVCVSTGSQYCFEWTRSKCFQFFNWTVGTRPKNIKKTELYIFVTENIWNHWCIWILQNTDAVENEFSMQSHNLCDRNWKVAGWAFRNGFGRKISACVMLSYAFSLTVDINMDLMFTNSNWMHSQLLRNRVYVWNIDMYILYIPT